MMHIQEKRLFLVRNDEVLLFKYDSEYDGDLINIEEFTKPEFLRYIGIKLFDDGVKEIYYYFAKTNDLYFTHSGLWTNIRKAASYPAKPLTSAVLKNYIRYGQYDQKLRIGVKSGDEVDFSTVTE